MLLPPREERDLVPLSLHCELHGGTVLCVGEIGMYRCSESEHVARMQRTEAHFRQMANGSELTERRLLQHFSDQAWTPWLYNQVVGWLRIHAFPRTNEHGTPCISGEYYAIDAKRLSKDLKHKRFLWAAEAFAVVLEGPIHSRDVFERVSRAIEAWRESDRIRGITLDLSVWENVGPHMDWSAILLPELPDVQDP